MKEFKVLPTDSRFLDLTEEQMELLYNHYMLDNAPVKETKKLTNSDDEPEHYHDPDFEKEWDELETDKSDQALEDEWEEV